MWRKVVPPTKENPVGYVYGDNDSPTMFLADPPTPKDFDDGMFGWMIAAKDTAAADGGVPAQQRFNLGREDAHALYFDHLLVPA